MCALFLSLDDNDTPTPLAMATSGSQAPATEPLEYLLNDRINLMAATTVPGIAYGIMLSLYATCAYFLVQNLRRCRFSGSSRSEWYKNLFWLAYTTTLFILATIYTASDAQNAALGLVIVLQCIDPEIHPTGFFEIIALLIILWIARGKAWCDKTQAVLSTIQFASARVEGSVMVGELAGVREDVIELGGLGQVPDDFPRNKQIW
ncbi:hypothetical protein HYDPIDRAFT_40434 [Hydnomerulius pinastri MD-312]|uniref:Uncharacterized protein n=1 Tax=Hydnomerulius pinastri MD-312 TaxID=994086 RepID=A0A0C9W965_9AGAM|nr:hypothetical protein HYDPIDRAFT_40434 [Hydnomerulius pinastri MD-312]